MPGGLSSRQREATAMRKGAWQTQVPERPLCLLYRGWTSSTRLDRGPEKAVALVHSGKQAPAPPTPDTTLFHTFSPTSCCGAPYSLSLSLPGMKATPSDPSLPEPGQQGALNSARLFWNPKQEA